MTDDDNAPLGFDRAAFPRRRLPMWPFLAGPSLVILAGLAVWAALTPDASGGQAHVVVNPPALAQPLPAAAPQRR